MYLASQKKDIASVLQQKAMQRETYKYLLTLICPFSLRKSLYHRISRWFHGCELDNHCESSLNVFEIIRGKVPPCVLFAYICTVFNGWTTTARFQNKDNVCLICIDCEGDDTLEHYSTCVFQWKYFAKRFNKSVLPLSLPRFLGLYTTEVNDLIVHCVHIYAVKSMIDKVRSRQQILSTQSQIDHALDEGYKIAMIAQGNLAKAVLPKAIQNLSCT